MSNFFKDTSATSSRKKRERKSTAKVIAMKEMMGAGKTIVKKKNIISNSGKNKTPYYVKYHERKDGILVKTFRCSKCAAFMSADSKACGKCIAKMNENSNSGDISKINVQATKANVVTKVNTKISSGNMKSKTPKKILKDGTKNKKGVTYKMNAIKKIKTKTTRAPKPPLSGKSIQKKATTAYCPKKSSINLKSQSLIKTKSKLDKLQKVVGCPTMKLSKEMKPKPPKSVQKPRISVTETQVTIAKNPTVMKNVGTMNIEDFYRIEHKLNLPEKEVIPRKPTLIKVSLQSKRKNDSQFDSDKKSNALEGVVKKCRTENVPPKVRKIHIGNDNKIQKNEPMKLMNQFGQNFQTGIITTTKPIIASVVSTKSEKPTEEVRNRKSEKQTIKVVDSILEVREVQENERTNKENLPEGKDSFFSYLNLEQNNKAEFSLSQTEPIVEEPIEISDTNILAKECFSGFLNSPNIEIIEEKEKNENNLETK